MNMERAVSPSVSVLLVNHTEDDRDEESIQIKHQCDEKMNIRPCLDQSETLARIRVRLISSLNSHLNSVLSVLHSEPSKI